MSLLLALPLLPLAVAGWLALSSRSGQLATGWVVALVAAFPVAVAALLAPDRIELPELLVLGTSALVLDDTARAALLLFGGLWLTSGLLLTRTREQGPGAMALLLSLSGAMTLALAEGGPLVYAGMLAVGYGLYAIMAGEPGDAWRRAGRALIVLLVVSDVLVFELLLNWTASLAVVSMPRGLILLGLAALVLRSGVPPAHAWLPPALAAVGTPTAVLLVAAPAGAGMIGVLKLLPGSVPEVGVLCVLLGLAGAAWAMMAGLAQVQPRTTLAYALAASAALLLMAVPAGVGAGGQLAWLVLALLASCAALPLVALQHAGWTRDIGIAAALLVHGLAGGQAALHAAAALPAWAGFLAPLAAVAATLLLTVTARRTPPAARDDEAVEATHLAYTPIFLAAAGLVLAWVARLPEIAYTWVAPVGITLGLIVFRMLPRRAQPRIPPGDLLGPAERVIGFLFRWLRVLALRWLPRVRDRLGAWVLGLWDGDAWSRRIHHMDLRLRAWPATGVMMLLVALGAAVLLAR
jgi:hypothetical protein